MPHMPGPIDDGLLQPQARVWVCSRRLSMRRGLGDMLGGSTLHWLHPGARVRDGDVLVGWGRGPSGQRARAVAERTGCAYLLIEQGFLHFAPPRPNEPLLSLVVDGTGIHYDACAPSDLERLLDREIPAEACARARGIVRSWREGRVSACNQGREIAGALPERFVLVADQTTDDLAISYGLAAPHSFSRMLEAALDENPDCTVLLWAPAQVVAGRGRGHFATLSPGVAARVRVLGAGVHAAGLLERAAAVYVVSSPLGFEALLWDRSVRTFGMPFYAGRGLTGDELAPPPWRRPLALERLVHAALVDYSRYLDAETGRPCPVEAVLAHLALQRRMRERFAPQVYAVDFPRWKRPIVRAFLQGSTVKFVRGAARVPDGATMAVWGRRAYAGGRPGSGPLIRLEDGFLRSVGLGAGFVAPLSLVADTDGIYYDATGPSTLERLLQHQLFSEDLTERGARLRTALVRHGLTKYNVGAGGWQRPAGHRGPVILVPGQVETDASIEYGAPDLRTNLGLLKAVRAAHPAAYVVYKPHPDVLAGLRAAGAGEDSAVAWCDEMVTDVPMSAMLDAVDEVHVLTSLAGFEALLRGKRVVTYGQPFYAGWGLTDDRTAPPRRTRTLTLEQLVAGTLILYPAYVSRHSGRFTTAERAMEELLAWREAGVSQMAWPRRLWRRLLVAVWPGKG